MLCNKNTPDLGRASWSGVLYYRSIMRYLPGAIIYDRLVETETAGKVVDFKTVTLQNPGCHITAQAALADHIFLYTLFHIGPFPRLFILLSL